MLAIGLKSSPYIQTQDLMYNLAVRGHQMLKVSGKKFSSQKKTKIWYL